MLLLCRLQILFYFPVQTFEIPSDGVVEVADTTGRVIFTHPVKAGDVWRMCQTKNAPIKVGRSVSGRDSFLSIRCPFVLKGGTFDFVNLLNFFLILLNTPFYMRDIISKLFSNPCQLPHVQLHLHQAFHIVMSYEHICTKYEVIKIHCIFSSQEADKL